MPRHATRALVAITLALSPLAAGCGATTVVTPPTATSVAECRAQWSDVAETIIGLDDDSHPSALATRWTSVAATVSLYENTDTAKDCQETIEAQVTAIALLRDFMPRLQPYDMAFQLSRLEAPVDVYLHDPLPEPVRNAKGTLVRPPTKAAVSRAIEDLRTYGASANTELAPGWGQLATVELSDTAAVTSALRDLEFLAQDSPNWRRCNQALKVIVAATQYGATAG
ncbi:MAG: hypothetical protein JWQ74_3438 [Marmoricola sp.]|nr:hypothetical protein [Marmoricola sp.]